MMPVSGHRFPVAGLLFLLATCLLTAAVCAQTDPLTVSFAVESADVFVGEPFQAQLQVSGTTTATPPDLSMLKNFDVQFLRAVPNSSTQVSIVNGHMTRQINESVVLNYRLTAKRAGRLSIPTITVTEGGRTARTRPMVIEAHEPGKTSGSASFEVVLPKRECYVGEPIVVKWTAFLEEDTRSVEFHVPLLERPEFEFPKQTPQIDPAKQDLYRKISLGPNQEVLGLLGSTMRQGKRVTTLSFEIVMIPRTPGTFTLPRSTATCQVSMGYERSRSRNDFFDSFFNQRRERLRRVAVVTDEPVLNVHELPTEGRPASFSGYVGRLDISIRAEPTVANVGDPINLQILISGSDYLDFVECPEFQNQPDFASAFRVSEGDAPGEIQGSVKVFRRVLRATNPDVQEIPSVEMAYFDTAKGGYEVARSNAIPLTIKATKVVTAMDAEGVAPVSSAGKALRAWSKGIAHNYEDSGVLVNQRAGVEVWLSSPVWLSGLVAPPVFWGMLALALGAVRRRHADPLALAARKAGPACLTELKRIRPDAGDGMERLLETLRRYFGAKLGVPGGALTFADIREQLGNRGLAADTLDALGGIFEVCEAGRYAGRTGDVSIRDLVQNGIRCVKATEKAL